jgi:hypothetical protein
MNWTHVIWDDTPGGNVEHVEQHDLTSEDVNYVLENYESASVSRATGSPCVFGYTPDGRYVIVIYDQVDADTVRPRTAYEVPEP